LLILLPLYDQAVRHSNPLATGLLLVPQGVGAAIVMPIAGRLTGKLGTRRVVAAGMTLAMLGTLAYTQGWRARAHTSSYAFLAVALLVIGFGPGSTSMPLDGGRLPGALARGNPAPPARSTPSWGSPE